MRLIENRNGYGWPSNTCILLDNIDKHTVGLSPYYVAIMTNQHTTFQLLHCLIKVNNPDAEDRK